MKINPVTRLKITLSFVLTLLIMTSALSQTPKLAETVQVNGSQVYYEVYGSGTPLFFLHGFTHSSKSWIPYLNDYLNDYEVYLVDLKGHGKSDRFTETLSIQSAAREVDGLIKHLRLDSINAIGYSYGGDVLFQLALLNPGLIKSMVVIGACGICNVKDFPHWIDYLSYENIDNLPWIREAHTSEDQIKSILEQLTNYNVSVSDIEFRSITTRVLLVIGDGEDSILWEDILKAKNNLPNVSLWVVPNTGHRAHKDKNKDEFVRVSNHFLKQTPVNPIENDARANTELIRMATQGVNDRDFTFVQSCFTNDFKRHDLAGAFPATGAGSGEPINFLQLLLKAFPDMELGLEDIFSNGPRATAHFIFTGTHTGELLGFKPTGKKVKFSGNNLYRFENGKIAEVWNLWDWFGVMQQIDAFPLD